MSATIADEKGNELRTRALAIFFGVGGVVVCAVLVLLLVRLWPVAVLLLISLMLVAALEPIIRRIQDRFTRKVATTAVVVSLLLGILLIIAFTIPPVLAQFKTLASDFDRAFKQIQALLNESSPDLAKMLGQVKVAAMPSGTEPHAVKEVIFSVFTMITGFVTVLMLTSYLVVEGPAVATALVSVFPRKHRLQVRQMFSEIGDQAGSYIRGQLFTSFLAGLFTYVVLRSFSVPNALALAWLMAILDVVPIVGPILGIVPAVVSAYAVSDQKAILVLVLLTAYHQVESYWIVPRVYGRALQLSSLTVLFSIVVGATLLGMVGAFIALPIAAVIPILLRYFNLWRNQTPQEPDLPGEVG